MNFVPSTDIEREFAFLCGIPHGSFNEKALSDAIRDRMTAAGHDVHQDEHGNVLVRRCAAPGFENKAPIMLQGHLDMVCTKVPGCEHDFLTDPLTLILEEDGWLHADGTSLGADCGGGVAYMLALLMTKDLKAPEMECLFTVEEEVGLSGAAKFDCSLIRSRRMISLDSGAEGSTVLSTAGGRRIYITLPMKPVAAQGKDFRISIGGLTGGHSAGMIHLGRANAIVLLGHILAALKRCGAALVSFDAGEAHNAIPRDGWAVVRVPEERLSDAETAFAGVRDRFLKLHRDTDPDISITMTETGSDGGEAYDIACANLIAALPDGLVRMEPLLPDVKQLSSNLGTLRLDNGCMVAQSMIRSTGEAACETLTEQILAVAAGFGAKAEIVSDYPGMEYMPVSPLRDFYAALIQQELGRPLMESATHGGMEVGYFSRRIPGMDIISFGSEHKGIHSPSETMNLASFNHAYGILLKLLETLP